MKKNTWVNGLVILGVLILALIILLNANNTPNTDEETAKCIGENSILYVQLGCHYCEAQENMFGNYTHYLEIVDCFYERDKCDGIGGTPSWEIGGKIYEGVQSIETLTNLTGC